MGNNLFKSHLNKGVWTDNFLFINGWKLIPVGNWKTLYSLLKFARIIINLIPDNIENHFIFFQTSSYCKKFYNEFCPQVVYPGISNG